MRFLLFECDGWRQWIRVGGGRHLLPTGDQMPPGNPLGLEVTQGKYVSTPSLKGAVGGVTWLHLYPAVSFLLLFKYEISFYFDFKINA